MHRALFSVLRPTPARHAKRERQHPNGLGGMREAQTMRGGPLPRVELEPLGNVSAS